METHVKMNSNKIKFHTSYFDDFSLTKKGGSMTPNVGLISKQRVNMILISPLLVGLNQFEATLVGQFVIKLFPIPLKAYP